MYVHTLSFLSFMLHNTPYTQFMNITYIIITIYHVILFTNHEFYCSLEQTVLANVTSRGITVKIVVTINTI